MEAEKQRSWKLERIFFDADGYFAHLIAGIDSAQQTIEFETYIFTKDALGDSVIAALERAQARGVKVRLLVDGWGSPTWIFDYAPALEKARFDFRIFHPLRVLGRLNKRNHRKVCVVDRARAWVGGRNVSAAHREWRDTSAYVEGEQVSVLTQIFDESWGESWSSYRKSYSEKTRRYLQRLQHKLQSYRVRVYSGFSSRKKAYQSFFNKIHNAQTRIWITNAYFVPTQKIIFALAFAARNKVDVRLIVPGNSDLFIIQLVSSALYQELLNSGVKIYEFGPQMMHAKTVLIDDWAIVGTTNLNHRSLLHDLEVEVVLSKQESVATLSRQFEADIEHSHEVTLQDWKNRPLWKRFIGRLLLKLRYWL